MSITDELRKYAQDWRETPNLMDDLDAGDIDGLLGDIEHIADRIDAEHESAWVELPKDADGEYIHIGDVMEWCDSGETLTVEGIGSDVLFYIDGENAEWTAARNKRHHHAPTVEDVLREFVSEFNRDDTELCDEEIIERFAAKLRLAESEDA